MHNCTAEWIGILNVYKRDEWSWKLCAYGTGYNQKVRLSRELLHLTTKLINKNVITTEYDIMKNGYRSEIGSGKHAFSKYTYKVHVFAKLMYVEIMFRSGLISAFRKRSDFKIYNNENLVKLWFENQNKFARKCSWKIYSTITLLKPTVYIQILINL